MWESDDLRESKWQSDSIELERRRQREMRNGGEEGEETRGRVVFYAGRDVACFVRLCSSKVSFLKDSAAAMFINHNFLQT